MPRTRLHGLLATLLAVGLALTGAAFAGSSLPGDSPSADPPSPSARLKAIKQDLADAEAALERAWAKLPDPQQDDPEVVRLREAAVRAHRAGIAAALEIAQADPRSEVGFDALEWLLLRAPAVYSQPAGQPALELMTRHHAANPKVGWAVARVAYFPPFGVSGDPVKPHPAHGAAVALLTAVAEKNPDRAARGQAAMGLAWQALRAYHFAAHKAAPDAERLKTQAERAFEGVIKDYDDCLYLGMNKGKPAKSTLGKLAHSELSELRHLQPGQPAPDTEGEDLNGAKFKLSDYRGNVVLLVFWGSWCGPCMAAVPHEKQLVERFKGRPFALIGVNSDDDREKALGVVAKHQIPWRSFWNGPAGPTGPIADAWNVRSWPTVYVIDHRGVIRHNNLGGDELDEPLQKLVTDAEAIKERG